MGYIRAEDVLPAELLARVQEYVDGKALYIPRKDAARSDWGSQSGAQARLALRNRRILAEHQAGCGVNALAERYFLSAKSIQRILRQARPSTQSESKEGQP